MIRQRDLVIGLLLTSSPMAYGAASAQAAAPQCVDQLSVPTRDSVTLRVMLTVSAVDPGRPLPAILQMDIAAAIKKYLRLPTPLALDVYEVSRDTSAPSAHLALWGNYEAALTAAGRMRGAAIVAGARHAALDAALLTALRSIDSTDDVSTSVQGIQNDLRLRIQLFTREAEGPARFILDRPRVASRPQVGSRHGAIIPADSALTIPLFLLRVPLLAVCQLAGQEPGVGSLRYPTTLRQAGVQGEALAAFIIGSDGVAEMESFFVPGATHQEFAGSVRQALPTFRFTPLIIGGCAVRSIVQQPFTFTLGSTP